MGIPTVCTALLELLDPQRFFRGMKVPKKMLEDVMVRRLKDDLRKICGGFPERKVLQENIEGLPENAPELRLAALLDEYRGTRELRLSGETRRTPVCVGAAYLWPSAAPVVLCRGIFRKRCTFIGAR